MESTQGSGDSSMSNGVESQKYLSGWLFRYIQEGWLIKRWRKRWCILKDDQIVLYEFEPKGKDDKHCGVIILERFSNCVQANKKESKKSPYTFVLEQKESENKANQKDKSNKKEVFYAEDQSAQELWMKRINDNIVASKLGNSKPLDHVTKARAKPGQKRRPPTRNHLRERAIQCEVTMETLEEPKPEPQKKGRVPTTALKPLLPGSKKSPLSQSNETNTCKDNQVKPTVNGNTNSPKLPLKSIKSKPPEIEIGVSSSEIDEEMKPLSPPPPTPPKALKPTLKQSSVKKTIEEEQEDKDGEVQDEEDDEPKQFSESAYTEENKPSNPIPPPTPPKVLKPILRQPSIEESIEEELEDNESENQDEDGYEQRQLPESTQNEQLEETSLDANIPEDINDSETTINEIDGNIDQNVEERVEENNSAEINVSVTNVNTVDDLEEVNNSIMSNSQRDQEEEGDQGNTFEENEALLVEESAEIPSNERMNEPMNELNDSDNSKSDCEN